MTMTPELWGVVAGAGCVFLGMLLMALMIYLNEILNTRQK